MEVHNISNTMEKGNALQNEIVTSNVTPEKQNSFLESTLGKTINTAVDIGLRIVLPDVIENQVIEIKDELLKNGLKAGIDKSIQSAMDLGKSSLGIVTGKFDNVSQVQNAISKGGIIDSLSSVIDFALKVSDKKGVLPRGVSTMIGQGKNVLLDNITNNIEKTFTNQLKSVEKIEKYSQNWKESYQEKDFSSMQREYEKIKEEIKNVIPLENTLKKAREIENLHILIKNKGQDFSLSQEEINLANRL